MKRAKILRYLLVAAVAIIAVRLFVIQILQHDAWVERAAAEHIIQNTILAERGEIYMMDGDTPTAVVMNESVFTVVVDPMLADPDQTGQTIDGIIKDKVIVNWPDVFSDRTRRYYVVARGVSRQEVNKLKAEAIPGVWYQEGSTRVYPEGQLGSTVLGFVNAEGQGQYGVEGVMDEQLSGTDGLLKTVTDVNNVALSIGDDNIRIPAQDGANIVLTIDRNIQNRVEQVLQDHMTQTNTHHTSALVMDPNTGRVLAMVSYPSYDPADYASVTDASAFSNDVLEGAYEPGSICKSFIMAAAVNEGKMTPDTTYYNEGSTTVDNWKIDNADVTKQLGTIDMRTALKWSLNTGSIQALRLLGDNPSNITQLGKERMYDYYYNRFGLGQYTGIELYEAPGVVIAPGSELAYNSRYANMTFGQGLNVTMVQVAAAFSSVVNGGKYYQPTMVAGEIKDGEFIKKPQQEAVRQTISEETSATMRDMLHSTRWWLNDPAGYYYGGKTGTAQAIRNGAYVMDEFVSGYIGFGGASGELPRYVIIVKMWEEGRTISSDEEARPMFEDINNYLKDYLRIAPGS